MDDVFARIGLALQHLLNQSSVNGPAKEEVQRLSDELQRFEGGVGDIIDARIQARMDQIEGRVFNHVDDNFGKLATVLEAAEITFTPTPAPLPVYVAPAPEDLSSAPAPPASTTGNIPAVPEPAPEPVIEPAPESEAAPVSAETDTILGGQGTDTLSSTQDGGAVEDTLLGGQGEDTVVAAATETPIGGAGDDSITATGEDTSPGALADAEISTDTLSGGAATDSIG